MSGVAASVGVLLSALGAGPIDEVWIPPSYETSAPPACMDDEDCTSPSQPYCHPDWSACTECVVHVHCEPQFTCQPTGWCVPACETDDDCVEPGLARCDVSKGWCVECLEDADCNPGDECTDGGCSTPFTCDPGELLCFGGNLYRCHVDGRNITEIERCTYGCADGACIRGEEGTTGDRTTTGGADRTGGDSSGGEGVDEGTDGARTDSGGSGDLSDRGCGCDTTPTRPAVPVLVLLMLVAGAVLRPGRGRTV